MLPKVKDLTTSSVVEAGFYAVADVRSHVKKDGTRYLRGRLRDATGSIDVVAWEKIDEAQAALIPGRVVKIKGTVAKAFAGDGLELTVQKIRAAREDEFDPLDFLPRSHQPIEDLVRDLGALADTLPSKLRRVVWRVLEPELDRFRIWPGAAEIHHAWIGGLLEHSIEVARTGDAIARVIDGPNRDLVVAGGLLHDVGKLDAYQLSVTISATDRGRLLGHVLTGFHRVQVACSESGLEEELTLRLLHVVASHHGAPEFGAAREPMTPEAIVVHFADELSAQLNEVRAAIAERSDPSSPWTNRARGLRREIFFGNGLPDLE